MVLGVGLFGAVLVALVVESVVRRRDTVLVMYAREHHLAETLQRSLLPTLPTSMGSRWPLSTWPELMDRRPVGIGRGGHVAAQSRRPGLCMGGPRPSQCAQAPGRPGHGILHHGARLLGSGYLADSLHRRPRRTARQLS